MPNVTAAEIENFTLPTCGDLEVSIEEGEDYYEDESYRLVTWRDPLDAEEYENDYNVQDYSRKDSIREFLESLPEHVNYRRAFRIRQEEARLARSR